MQFVYWEKQQEDLLCGLHTLNSLVQAPLFNEIQLAQIGQQLDQQEQMLLNGINNQTNVNMSGNFSLQVLIEALKQTGNFQVSSIKSQEVKNKAFVCHNDNHWFAIRKIHGHWINLNSTNKTHPQIVSDFYFNAFLDSILQNGYQVFVIDGDFIEYDPQIFIDQIGPHQRFFTLDDILKAHEEDKKNPKFQLNISGADQEKMEKALQESLESYKKETQQNNAQNEKKESNFFQGQEHSLYTESGDNDSEMVQAIKFSMLDNFPPQDDTEEVEGEIYLRFRLPNGKTIKRRFSKDCLIQTIYDYVFCNLDSNKAFILKKQFPELILDNIYMQLDQVQLSDMDLLNVLYK